MKYHFAIDHQDGKPVKVITVVIDGAQKSVKGEATEAILEAIKANDEEKVKELVDLALKIKAQSKGLFEVRNGAVYVEDQQLPVSLGKKIIDYSDAGLPYDSLIAFWNRLKKNPSFRSVQCLFNFLDHNQVPLTEDGCFVAFKGVRKDFKDIHSGTIDNTPGTTVKMPRNEVNDDPNQTCSSGLHVAGWNYAAGTAYGDAGRYLEIKVDPEHVVAVPTDYNFQKMRVCEYYVVKEVTEKPSNILIASGPEYCCDIEDDDYDDEEEDEDDDYYDDLDEELDPEDDDRDW